MHIKFEPGNKGTDAKELDHILQIPNFVDVFRIDDPGLKLVLLSK